MNDILQSPLLSQFSWLDHGFGTRKARIDQEQMASLKQIHSPIILLSEGTAGCVGEGDALVTNGTGVSVSVRTADCYPILLVDPVHRAVAAVHAGWRGTHGKIVEGALKRMQGEFGSRPVDTFASIGPGIGACCYQVGKDVAEKFGMEDAGPLDLARENWKQLIGAGVPEAHIDLIGRCTFCEAEFFYSFRREAQEAGRMISYAGVRAE